MNTQHAKSPCCQAKIYRFGYRRRQCELCKRTWTMRPKKRGRPVIRMSPKILRQIFLERFTLQHLAPRRARISLVNFRYRFRQTLQRFVASPSPQRLPYGSLTLLADGLRFHFRRRPWVLYLVAIKACSGKTAIFLDPVLLSGKEGAFRWQQVFAGLPAKTQLRTRALVVDNLNGMKKIAKQRGWILQLCHFHLIRKLQVQWKRPRRALKGGIVREEIYQLIREALETSDTARLQYLLARLTHLADMKAITLRLQAILRDFLHSVPYYRSLHAHPELHLPATTNTVESMACVIRDLLRRTRCASNPKALLRWATALIRLRPTVTCNGKVFNRIV
jgi:hypothetical protein